MVRYVGLDVHKRLIVACIVDQKGNVLVRDKLENFDAAQLRRWFSQRLQPSDQVALEITTNAKGIARILADRVAAVTLSNPLATKAIAAAKIKTDKVDAEVLAQLLRCGYLPDVWRPDPDTDRNRELVGRRVRLVRQRTQLKNRLHAVLAVRLLVPPADLFTQAGRSWLRTVAIDELGTRFIESDLRLLEAIEQEIDLMDGELAQIAWNDERCKLLMTLPGVDRTVALALLAAWGDIGRFRDADAAAAYLGLAPSTRQSASKCYHGGITKRGSSNARWMLTQAAQRLDRHPGPLGAFFKKIAKRKHRNIAVIACARKLACIAWHLLTKNEPYRYALPGPTEEKLRRLRTQVAGQRRQGGVPKGTKAVALRGAGTRSRTVRSLPEVYASENLPPVSAPTAGELRALAESQTLDFARSLSRSTVQPRKQPNLADPEAMVTPKTRPAKAKTERS